MDECHGIRSEMHLILVIWGAEVPQTLQDMGNMRGAVPRLTRFGHCWLYDLI
jgi:hypothetical protein